MWSRRNALSDSAPFEVELAIKRLGTNLRTARLRRNMTLEEVAEKLGVTRQIISRAETGNINIPAALYVGLLWAYGLLDQFSELADPALDKEGLALSLAHQRLHARHAEELDNDF